MDWLPDQSINLILCDLPYKMTHLRWDKMIPLEPLWEQYKRLITPNGVIALTAVQPFTSKLVMSNLEMFRYDWVWEKNNVGGFMNARYMPLRVHESVLIFSPMRVRPPNKAANHATYNPQGVADCQVRTKGRSKPAACCSMNGLVPGAIYTRTKTGFPKSILKFASATKTVHPTQKPVPLFEYLIRTYSNEGDTVLDNAAGSGTTGVACINTNRNGILIENDPQYIEVIENRTDCRRITEWGYRVSEPIGVADTQ